MSHLTKLALAACILASSSASADDYMAMLDAEATKVTSADEQQLNQQRRKLMISAPSFAAQMHKKSTVFTKADQRSRNNAISLSGFTEVLRFQAKGSLELFDQLPMSDKHDVLEAYNAGASLADLRPMIASLYE